MVSKKRTYTLITGSNRSIAEVPRDLEINPTTLYKWIRQYSESSTLARAFLSTLSSFITGAVCT